MKKVTVILAVLAFFLSGCSRDTMVYIPEDAAQMQAGVVVNIPVKPTEEQEMQSAVATETAAPQETEPEQKNSATVSKKTTGSSNKKTSGSTDSTTNKDTITGNSQKPAETQPSATEPGGGQANITVTVPPAAQPSETEPSVTEPVETTPPVTEPPLYDISGYVVSDLEYAVLDQINEYRTEAGLEELYLDEYLCAIASCRSFEASQVWSHTRPDGRSYHTVLDDYGYGGSAAGELLGYATGDGAAIVDKWMSSESHRASLLGGSSAVGIGIYSAGGVIYVACLLIG